MNGESNNLPSGPGDPQTSSSSTTTTGTKSVTTLADNEENVDDSGISADKTESNSSDEPNPSSSAVPKVEAMEINNQPSTSTSSADTETAFRKKGFKTFKTKGRNYRLYCKRSHPVRLDSDDDEDDDEMDSDDIQSDDPVSPTVDRLSVQDTVEDIVASVAPNASNVKPLTNNDADSDSDRSDPDDVSMDSDSDAWSDVDSSCHSEPETPFVLLKRKPTHKWSIVNELNQRQLGHGIGMGKQGKGDVLFEQRFYGSLHAVERLELIYKLNAHKGCVNCINFHPEGKYLVSGSDDLNIVIWDWAIKKPFCTVKTGHKSNVFQCKFMHLNAESQINIVTCARDGQVRLLQVPPSGGPASRRKLTQHSEPAHKLHVSSAEPHIVISSGEDGQVLLSDLREENATNLITVRSDRHTIIPLYSVSGHPLDSHELCVAGKNHFVRVYDRRKAGKHARPVKTFCPEFFLKQTGPNNKRVKLKQISLYITHAIYNHNGSEILASYNDDDIYLFDSKLDADTAPAKPGYTYRYAGHRNSETFKGVSFFGPHSEFVVSGSDCGNIFIWDKKTEAIVQWMAGDEAGTVNCIECHPTCPVMATSGLDCDVKVWVPSNENEPKLEGLREMVIANNRAQLRMPLFDEYSLIPNLLSIFNGVAAHSMRDSDESGSDSDDSHMIPGSRDIQCQQS